ncbi:MAG TPA: thiamine-phosphate kinase [Methylophaga sp.]|nr:thiamine-phosphate kinase [Methylophaga sp.]
MNQTSEFSLIKAYFSALTADREDVVLGIGDDCALLKPPAGKLLATSVDTLVSDVHFFADVDAYRLGQKALAVNLSDLAAMGANPAWFTLALTIPRANPDWLKAFSAGIADLAKQHDLQLVGGDTTRGSLAITIQITGFVDADNAFRRDAAQPGDKIYVSGTLGDAGAGLLLKQGKLPLDKLTEAEQQFLVDRLELPTPRNSLASQLVGEIQSAIDISDGLLADLQHILTASQVGAVIDTTALPLSSALQKLPVELANKLAMTAGDDYELCFTVSPNKAAVLEAALNGQVTCIGEITTLAGLKLLPENAQQNLDVTPGYDHFS